MSTDPRPRIVVGTDGSPDSDAGLVWALALAARRGARIEVLHAWQEPMVGAWPGLGVPVMPQGQAEHAAGAALRSCVERARQQVDASGAEVALRLVRGPAAHVLTEAAEGASLVVVTRRHGAVGRMLLGSVGTAVLHHVHCPVAVVPHDQPAPAQAPHRVVVGVDHEPHSRRALDLAATLADELGVPLRPVSVRSPFADGLLVADDDLREVERREEQALLDAALAAGDHAELKVDPVTAVGHAGAELVEQCCPDDLLVVGSRGRSGVAGFLLGSTSTHVAHRAPCPVLVTR